MMLNLHQQDLIQGYVDKGAAKLDVKVPDWYEKIDISTLDIESSYSCILGQVFKRRFLDGIVALFGSNWPDAGLWGFDFPPGFDETDADADEIWDFLKNAWIAKVAIRKEFENV